MGDIERWMSCYECVECGQEVPDDRGHVHVRVGDAHTTSPTRQVYYVPEDEFRGAVEALKEARPYVYNQSTGHGPPDWRRETAQAVLERLDAAIRGQ